MHHGCGRRPLQSGPRAVPASPPVKPARTRRTRALDCGADPKDLTELLRATASASRRPRPLKATAKGAAGPRNFEEFIYQVWGAGIAKHFAVPYNRKIWAVPLDQMETSWLGGRVPMPDLEEMITGALTPKAKPMGPNARFGYPLRGGFQALMNGFLPLLEGASPKLGDHRSPTSRRRDEHVDPRRRLDGAVRAVDFHDAPSRVDRAHGRGGTRPTSARRPVCSATPRSSA